MFECLANYRWAGFSYGFRTYSIPFIGFNSASSNTYNWKKVVQCICLIYFKLHATSPKQSE